MTPPGCTVYPLVVGVARLSNLRTYRAWLLASTVVAFVYSKLCTKRPSPRNSCLSTGFVRLSANIIGVVNARIFLDTEQLSRSFSIYMEYTSRRVLRVLVWNFTSHGTSRSLSRASPCHNYQGKWIKHLCGPSPEILVHALSNRIEQNGCVLYEARRVRAEITDSWLSEKTGKVYTNNVEIRIIKYSIMYTVQNASELHDSTIC